MSEKESLKKLLTSSTENSSAYDSSSFDSGNECINFHLSNFGKLEFISAGGQGAVYKAEFLPSGKFLALKSLTSKKSNASYVNWVKKSKGYQRAADQLKEYNILFGIKHKNIVQLLGYISEDTQNTTNQNAQTANSIFSFIVMEYAEFGCLDRVVRNYRPLSYNLIRNYCLDICRALSYLHEELSVTVVHRDIKLKNILAFGENFESSVCKLGDFGLATSMVDQHSVEVLRVK